MTRLSRRTAVAGLLATTFALPSVRARGLAGGSRELLLLDASLDAADHRATAALRATRRPRMVQADLVHQWRGGLQRELAAQAGTVTALVRWDKALLLVGPGPGGGDPQLRDAPQPVGLQGGVVCLMAGSCR